MSAQAAPNLWNYMGEITAWFNSQENSERPSAADALQLAANIYLVTSGYRPACLYACPVNYKHPPSFGLDVFQIDLSKLLEPTTPSLAMTHPEAPAKVVWYIYTGRLAEDAVEARDQLVHMTTREDKTPEPARCAYLLARLLGYMSPQKEYLTFKAEVTWHLSGPGISVVLWKERVPSASLNSIMERRMLLIAAFDPFLLYIQPCLGG